MEVYIEYVVIDNLVITALISAMSYRVLKAKKRRLRIFLASVVGTVAAIFYPFLNINVWLVVLVKLGVYALICIVLFAKTPYFVKGAFVFLLVTALMGGAMFMAGYMVFSSAQKALTMPFYNFPLGMVLLVPLTVYLAAKRLITSVHKRRGISGYIYKIELTVFEKTFNVSGFLDSGNLLFDKQSGLPVVVIGAALSAKILDNEQLGLFLTGQPKRIDKSARSQSFGTLGSGGKLLVIKPQNFRLYFADGKNTLKEVMLGLSFKALSKEFDALLPPSLF